MAREPERERLVVGGREVFVTNPAKVLFTEAGHTKLDVVRYDLLVADGALRAAGGRPNMLVRFPNGIGAEHFYQKRAPTPRPDWIEAPAVHEVASVSSCISPGPEGWIERWRHNALGLYDDEATAWSVVGSDRSGFDLYAYRAYPIGLDAGAPSPWEVPVRVALDLEGFERLGIDLVTRSVSPFFECSALSCNDAAAEFSANRFCLIDDLEAAYAACAAVSRGGYEPGPHHLIEVWRKRRRP